MLTMLVQDIKTFFAKVLYVLVIGFNADIILNNDKLMPNLSMCYTELSL